MQQGPTAEHVIVAMPGLLFWHKVIWEKPTRLNIRTIKLLSCLIFAVLIDLYRLYGTVADSLVDLL